MPKTTRNAFSTHTSGELAIVRADRCTIGFYRGEVCVLKESNQISLACFLKSDDSLWFKPDFKLEILLYIARKFLERILLNEQVCGLLMLSNLSLGDNSWLISVGLLATAGISTSTFATCLGYP